MDLYRKPCTGMWSYMLEKYKIKPKKVNSCIYVGDAAGRPNDWAVTDRAFAMNINARFLTPEEYFLSKEAEPFSFGNFNPYDYTMTDDKELEALKTSIKAEKAKFWIILGSPWCGKTTVAQILFKDYLHIADNTADYPKLVEQGIKAREQTILEIHNPKQTAYMKWIGRAKEMGIEVRCLLLDVPVTLALHNMYYHRLRKRVKSSISLEIDEELVRDWFRVSDLFGPENN
ncbi:MAG: hypothetical protein M1829_003122 [Trizodia sp. TS-e1964]|nr:MAG: hypothetical protein M1829_003122 [Trizodia sp. TS-e1964]